MTKLSPIIRAYAERGWPLIPLKGKAPLTKNGYKDATGDIAQIEKWALEHPGCAWGFTPGAAGIAVVDIDPRSGGDEIWDQICEEAGAILLDTPTVRTGSGGRHLYFLTNGETIKNAKMARGVDLISATGYVVIPPSVHPSGQSYVWDLAPKDVPFADFPDWLRDIPTTDDKKPAPPVDEVIRSGARNTTLTSLAGSMRRRGMSEEAMIAALLVENQNRCNPPLSDQEVQSIAHSIGQKEPEQKKKPEYHRTDLGNAHRLRDKFGNGIRFCFDLDTWLHWNQKRWKPDALAELEILAQETVLGMYDEISSIETPVERTELAKWAARSESRSQLTNMIYLARPHLPVLKSDLDQEPMAFNVRNGTIDLATGEIRDHDPRDMISKLSDIEYRPDAKCPHWQSFLKMILPGEEERRYLQSAIGYSLTGKTTEHCFFVLYGAGANGKTTFTETIRVLMADYAHRTDIQALMLHWKDRGSAPTPHVAALAGARFVLASEIPEGRKLNEPLIKDLTGGDSITARFLHANPFTYVPTHKLWMFGNYKPKITGTDLGMWRRVKIIDFPVTIPEDVQRPMDEVIGEFYDEMPGILSWAVEGCLDWVRYGLQDTEGIKTTTAEYRSEQDILQHFLDECCERHPDYKVLMGDLFRSMKTWAETNNESDLLRKGKRWLTYQLQMRGIERDSGKRNYVGIKLSIPF